MRQDLTFVRSEQYEPQIGVSSQNGKYIRVFRLVLSRSTRKNVLASSKSLPVMAIANEMVFRHLYDVAIISFALL